MNGYDLGDLTHLPDEHADLYAALYIERNGVSRGELVRVQVTAERARREAKERAWRAASDEWEWDWDPDTT